MKNIKNPSSLDKTSIEYLVYNSSKRIIYQETNTINLTLNDLKSQINEIINKER